MSFKSLQLQLGQYEIACVHIEITSQLARKLAAPLNAHLHLAIGLKDDGVRYENRFPLYLSLKVDLIFSFSALSVVGKVNGKDLSFVY